MAREYKDSGIEWIGQIPKEWRIVPFKAYFTTGKGLSFTKADLTPQGHAVVSYGQVHSKVNTGTRLDDFLLRYVPDSITANGESSKMNKGDFIIADTSEDLEGCGNCVYVDRDIELYAGYHSVTAKPKVQDNNKFFAYYFQTPCWRSQIRSRVTGIKVYSISQSIINQTWLFVPPLLIQQKIADYLDKVCGEADEMIALQEKMIEELKAYKQSIITEVVTKGLNPNVPMKNSGIDWIGEIPEHWEIIKIGFIFDNLDYLRRPISAEQRERNNPQYNYYGASGIIDKIDHYNVDDKVLLIGEDGANLVTRNLPLVYKAEGKFWVNNHAHILKPKFDDYNYMAFALEAANYRNYITGSAQPKLSQENLQAVKLPVPPIEEQCQIASYLDSKCSEIDSLIAIKQQKITELKEYKKSVIYEYVTGKKEVV
ncbi:MAG: restriction endonuclease subunit S [Prevotella sp.]|nr:restriction endonuclease subunit S [Prevotella sp.]